MVAVTSQIDANSEAFAANPWRFNADHTFVTERDGCHGSWFVSGDKRSLRMDWQDGQRGNYAEFLRRPGFPPTCDNVGSSMEFMRSWSLTLRGGGAAATTAQPGHSSPPSHAFPDARSFAGNFCTCFPCFPFVPLSCEKIISHDSNSYQAKGWTIMFLPIHIFLVPIPLCWDLHLARKHGNTFEVTTPGCAHRKTHDWTSADGFRSGLFCCPTGRCSLGAARRGWGGIHVAACAGGLLQVLLCPLLCLRGVTCDGGSVVHGCVGGCC